MSNSLATVNETIRSRRTFKVLADVENPITFEHPTEAVDQQVRDLIASAGFAPFHYDRSVDGTPEPWRCHIVWHKDCRRIAREMSNWFPEMKPSNKLPAMLSACGCLVLITWIPHTTVEGASAEKLTTINEEHLAATSAMVQNFLLLLTAANLGSYWSSGGQFKTSTMFEKLSVPATEKLAAAVFVEYPETQSAPLERLAGKNHAKRTPMSNWTREVNL